MVALNPAYSAEEEAPSIGGRVGDFYRAERKNRVGRFFSEEGNRVGENQPPELMFTLEIEVYVYDSASGVHKYLYANAAPNMWTDPTGLFTLVELQAAMKSREIIGGTARVQVARKGSKKVTKKLTCKVGVSFAKKQFVGDGLQGHHAIPKSLGGNPKQALVFLPAQTHRTFHWILNVVLKSEPGFNGKGNWTSAKNWESISQTKAGRQALYRAILESSRIVDNFCKLKGPNSLSSFVKKNRKEFLSGF